MKNKFILHGGFHPRQTSEDNSDFYKEILKDTQDKLSILVVPFAKDADRIGPTFERVSNEFNINKEGKNISLEIAKEENFIDQVKNSDIIYFQGGTSLKLLEALKNYPELKDYLKEKTIAGESAGANVLGTYFYSPSADSVNEGLGILPLKIIPHYKEEYKDKLEKVGEGLESLNLKEYEYKVLYV